MKEKLRWSPLRFSEPRISESLSLSRATAWRRRAGFIEDGWSWGAEASTDQIGLLTRWLASAGSALTLRLVFKVGGPQRSVAWMGLAADGATPRDARQHLVEPASTLGEALDAWGLFEDLPGNGPRYVSAGRAVVIQSALPSSDGDQECCGGGGSALLGALRTLARRRSPLSICLDIRGGDADPALFRELERVSAEAQLRADRAGRSIASFFDGTVESTTRLVRQVDELAAAATVGELSMRLHGDPPAALLRDQLLRALGADLGASLELEDKALEPRLLGQPAPLAALLRSLSVGTAAPVHRRRATARRGADMDCIPF